MGLRKLGRRVAVFVVVCAVWGCASSNETFDYGDGAVNSKGKPIDSIDDDKAVDIEAETQSRSQAIEEESIEDAVEDAER